jgi:hypothetical protein
MLLKKKFRNFISLSWADKWLLLQSVFWLISIKLGSYIFRFQTLRETLSKASNKNNGLGEPPQGSLDRVVWAIEKTSWLLLKALAAQVMLSQRGHEVEVIIGAKRDQLGQMKANAWFEHQGRVIIGDLEDLSRFSPLKSAEVYKL